jgi:PiT family inorganic phosphate transporter
VAKAGVGALIASGWVKPILFIFLSPFIGLAASLALTVLLGWLLYRRPAALLERAFRRLQLLSAAAFSLSHGANDAQKTMGIVAGLLVSAQHLFRDAEGWQAKLYLPSADTVPWWLILSAHTAIALGTAAGGWRIVKTMGTRITKLRPFGGVCAETGGAGAVFLASSLGIPVSTTHTITGAIVGVGAAQRLSAVRWGVAGRILWAWILTIPMAATMAAVSYVVLR